MKNISVFRQRGVNRISIGIQSFNQDELKFLERIHTPEEAVRSYHTVRNAGIDNVSIDLMFSIPNQTEKILNHTLDRAIELKPEHISAYSLIYEEGTPMYNLYKKGVIKALGNDADAALYNLIVKRLSEAGFKQYEVSNYAKNDKKCRHNLKYWESGEYFGFGPSAHGFTDKKRYWNVSSINNYIRLLKKGKLPLDGSEILTNNDKMYERIYLTLRAEGLDFKEFNKEFNINKKVFLKTIYEFEENELLKVVGDKIILTSKGYFLGDEISLKLIKILDKS